VSAILPGETIGILGGGQLGRMLGLEARRLGYRVAVLSESDGPASQVADVHVRSALNDLRALRTLAACSHVLTFETEHLQTDVLEDLEGDIPLRPSPAGLRQIQDRLTQRRFLAALGLPQARFASLSGPEDFCEAVRTVGVPSVLKTRRDGYDGRGQVRIAEAARVVGAWEALGRRPAVLEEFIDFEKEISVLLARTLEGEVRFFPIAENVHRAHVLHLTRVPAAIPPAAAAEAERIGAAIAAALQHVGVMTVELFLMRDGSLRVNEVALRVHNSGHYSFGACATSQFEQHVRAVCGLPLGDTSLLTPAVMLNLFGDLWTDGTPDWRAVLSRPRASLHLYGKRDAAPGRKMGHVLVVADSVEAASDLADGIAADLGVPR